jgi:hypothetical protein
MLEEPGSRPQDFLAGFNRSFAMHHQRWYRGTG